jgi:hypothetical protein
MQDGIPHDTTIESTKKLMDRLADIIVMTMIEVEATGSYSPVAIDKLLDRLVQTVKRRIGGTASHDVAASEAADAIGDANADPHFDITDAVMTVAVHWKIDETGEAVVTLENIGKILNRTPNAVDAALRRNAEAGLIDLSWRSGFRVVRLRPRQTASGKPSPATVYGPNTHANVMAELEKIAVQQTDQLVARASTA